MTQLTGSAMAQWLVRTDLPRSCQSELALGSNPNQCTVEVPSSALLMIPREDEISIYRDKYFSAFFEIQFIFKNTEQFQGLT